MWGWLLAAAWAAPALDEALLRDVYAHEDWPSAVLQARRVALLDPDDAASALVLATAYARTGRSDDAREILVPLLADDVARPWALLTSAWIASEEDDVYLARVWLDRHAAAHPSGPGATWREQMRVDLGIRLGDHALARRALEQLGEPAPALAARVARSPRRRSPALCGVLSAIVPGLGQLVAGQPVEAASALLANGALIAGTASAARRGATEGAVALGVVAVGFYAGNVYGGADAALRYNRAEQRELRDLLAADGLAPGLPPLPE